MNGDEPFFFFAVLEHREFGYPQYVVTAFVDKVRFFGKVETERAERRVNDFVLCVRTEEQNIAHFCVCAF